MIGRIIEISSDSRYLSLDRGFLVISQKGQEVGRVPIDDISALIGNAHGLSYSNNVLVALAERGSPFVLCGAQHRPVAVLWPVDGHHRQAARMDAQLRATLPLRKRLWKEVIQSKIAMQAAAVGLFDGPEPPIRRWISKVRAGDPSNIEGQAARTYWPLMFGPEFRRDQKSVDLNALLNYGYTVLRATVARHLMAAGLHPGIPIHHSNEGNAMRLVDDLMEPFRPLVDVWVRKLAEQGVVEVNPASKKILALLPVRTLHLNGERSPVTLAIQRLCVSLAQIYERGARKLQLPEGRVDALISFWTDDDASRDETED